jgi:DNA-binding protein
MENYTRVRQPRLEETTEEHQVRVTAAGKPSTYIAYAHALLAEKGHSTVELKAMGKAINKTVAIAEILKRRVAGLHQATSLSSTDITDVWEPKDAAGGLDRLETVRRVSVLTIVLSLSPADTSAVGYQAPLPEAEVAELGPEAEAQLAGEADGEGGEDGGRRRAGRSGGRGRRRGPRGGGAAGAGGEGEPAGEGEGGDGAPGGGRRRTGRPRTRRGRGRGEGGGGEGGGEGGGDAAPAPAAES